MGGSHSATSYPPYNTNDDFEVVIRATKDLEWLLVAKFAAPADKHFSLQDKITHVQYTAGLTETTVAKMRCLVTLRDKLVYEQGFNEMSNRAQFVISYNEVVRELHAKLAAIALLASHTMPEDNRPRKRQRINRELKGNNKGLPLEICKIIRDEQASIDWLLDNNIVRIPTSCPRCVEGRLVQKSRFPQHGFKVLRCNRSICQDPKDPSLKRYSASMFQGTFFEMARVPLNEQLKFLYLFLTKADSNYLREKLGWPLRTVEVYLSYTREMMDLGENGFPQLVSGVEHDPVLQLTELLRKPQLQMLKSKS